MELRFLQVNDNADKIEAISSVVQKHYAAGEGLLLLLPGEEAAAYLDQLLWRLPPEGFIPHGMMPTDERIAISPLQENPRKAAVVFNLCPAPFLQWEGLSLLYDLDDRTTPEKAELSQQRHQAYAALTSL